MNQALIHTLLVSALVAGGSASAQGSPTNPAENLHKSEILYHHPYAQKSVYPWDKVRKSKVSDFQAAMAAEHFAGYRQGASTRMSAPTTRGLADGKADRVLDSTGEFGFLDGPDGTTWYYTVDYDIYTYVPEGGAYTQSELLGYTYTVYDSNFKTVGTVAEKVSLLEGETRLASVGIDASVTQKFFNTDSKYEVMIVSFMNNYDYSISTHTRAYSLGGATTAEGTSQPIFSIDASPVDAYNFAADKWSEDFMITFMSEHEPEITADMDYIDFLNGCYVQLETYKKGGWSGAPSKVFDYQVLQTCKPGDQMDSPYFFTLKLNGKPTFAVTEYEKSFFEDPTADNPVATADNHLNIKLFQMASVSASEALPLNTTSLATPHHDNGSLYTFYSCGNIGFTNDILTTGFGGSESRPSFLITTEDYSISNDDSYIYGMYVYDFEGNLVSTLAEDADGYVNFTTPAGASRQLMAIMLDEFGYSFHILDLESGEEILNLPEAVGRELLTATVDRVRSNGKDYYAFYTKESETDGTNYYSKVAWINTNGEAERIDRVNLGPDVAYAQLNIDASVLQPYIFDTDDEFEYMALVKRYTGISSSTREELMISGAESGPMLTLGPDEVYGALLTVSVTNIDNNGQLMVVYRDNAGDMTQTFFNLPLSKFAGGDGTEANPYRIATAGDLRQLGSATNACYLVVKDIDATGTPLDPVMQFSGVIDGGNHTISNLSFTNGSTYVGILGSAVQGSQVKNLTLLNPTLTLAGKTSYAGVIAGNATGLKIENVHVYGLRISDSEADRADCPTGGLVGELTSLGSVTGSHVAGASINLPESSSVGGIVGATRTGVKLKGCAFSGRIEAATSVGGIAGSLDTGDETVADCHSDADIIGSNTIGGIAGYSNRATITRNYAEGSLRATTPGRWDKALSTGGVVGSLAPQYDDDLKDVVVVSNNVVAISDISCAEVSGTPAYAWQLNTVHRIVGKSGLNREPEIVDYDEYDEPVYGESAAYEGGLENNYSHSTLSLQESGVQAAHNSVEGADVERDAIGKEFLGNLGYLFGESADTPWHPESESNPGLHFEQVMIVNPGSITVTEGKSFKVNLHLATRKQYSEAELEDALSCDYSAGHLRPTGERTYGDNTVGLEFECLREGVSELTFSLEGKSVKATVTGTSGILTITATESSLSYDGSQLSAEGYQISLYTTAGVKAATGSDTLSVCGLPTGVYVAVAVDGNGRTERIKIIVK